MVGDVHALMNYADDVDRLVVNDEEDKVAATSHPS